MIHINEVYKSYGDLEVLKGVTMAINLGEVVSVIGSSGSGKSTMLHCVNGLEPINQGAITVDGTEVHAKDTDLNKLRRNIGMVFQQWNAFPHLTALENTALAVRLVLKKSRAQAKEIAREHLEKVGLGDKVAQYPASLSGGQQQRLAIARCLAMGPKYLLLDEVTSALDPELVGEVLDTLRLLRDSGLTMVVVTHEIAFAREVSDRIAYFYEGKVEEIGPPTQVIDAPHSERTRQFLAKVL